MTGQRKTELLDMHHVGTHLELMLRFAAWATNKGGIPAPEDIAAHFDVSKATAYRWRNAFCNAHGLPIPAPRLSSRFAPPVFPRKSRARRQPASNRN
ncbi:MAG: hypothetical protein NVV60_01575 [Luteimonas sp.]|nr:hypothetical protein [Luteimonas sp.]